MQKRKHKPARYIDRQKLPVIATDLDGIIGDTDIVLRKGIRDYFGIKISRTHVTDYYYENCLNISAEKFEKFWEWFVEKDYWDTVPLVRNARRCLKELSSGHRIFIYTSRPSNLQSRTAAWLKKKGLDFIDRIYHVDTVGDTKLSAINSSGIRPVCYIEDRLDFAQEVATQFPVYLFDYPWNRTGEDTLTMKRVKNWKGIMKLVKHL